MEKPLNNAGAFSGIKNFSATSACRETLPNRTLGDSSRGIRSGIKSIVQLTVIQLAGKLNDDLMIPPLAIHLSSLMLAGYVRKKKKKTEECTPRHSHG